MADTAPAPTPAPATTGAAAPTAGATAGTPNAPVDQNAASRGLPYYEKLRRELRDTLQKKRLMDKSMVSAISRSRPQELDVVTSARLFSRCANILQSLIIAISCPWRRKSFYPDVLLTPSPRLNSKTKSSASNNHTWKKPPLEISSRASTITSKALRMGRVSAPQDWVWAVAWPGGERRR
jgi:hypothetical protein